MNHARLFFRGLLLQAGWNRERMQALGFTFALLPLVRGRERAIEADFVRRHLDYVNTNPALSGVLLGAVAAAETGLLAAGQGGEAAREPVAALKRRFEGPLAALGDRVFWGWLRPLLGVLGILLLFLLGPAGTGAGAAGRGIAALFQPGRGTPLADPGAGDLGWAWASVLAALAFYNGPYLVTRWRAVKRGLELRPDGDRGLAAAARGFGATRIASLCEYLGPVLLGALAARLALAVWQGAAATVAGGARGVALLVAGCLIGAGAARFKVAPERVAMIVLALLLLAGASR